MSAFEETLIRNDVFSFLITKRPSKENIQAYLRLLQEYNVVAVVRVCEPSYPTTILEEMGITVYDWDFPDGQGPPKSILVKWGKLLRETYFSKTSNNNSDHEKPKTIALHCLAGLGRAPVLAAVAFIQFGMTSIQAVELIRSKRKGALNSKQIKYLLKYKKSKKICLIT
eukprot:TRINITY_DN652_c0_g1_i1.p1 TRINITY_DN652_c0_g1~~TRINITY_DN652_c0_g1_i1.p1  ORF type:complete len:169 (-),score=22.62 TRINITY_DN652_c0_g1_i1:191-697(-)